MLHCPFLSFDRYITILKVWTLRDAKKRLGTLCNQAIYKLNDLLGRFRDFLF